MRLILLLACLALPCLAQHPSIPPPDIWKVFKSKAAEAIAAQTDPAKLATLKGERAANPRLQRCVYWLATAEVSGEKPEAVLDEAAKLNGTAGTPYAGFLSWGLLRNLKIAHELGLLTPENMEELRRGKSATVTLGPYTGQEAEADHVIPRAVAPELQNQVMNLELLPAKLNRAKSDKVTDRARVFAKELYEGSIGPRTPAPGPSSLRLRLERFFRLRGGIPSGDRGLGARASGMSANVQKITATHPNQDLENLLWRI